MTTIPGRANFISPSQQAATWRYSVDDAGGVSTAYYPGIVSAQSIVPDCGPDIQAAIDAANAAGGGLVVIGVNRSITATLVPKSNVTIEILPGVTLTKNGTPGYVFESASTDTIQNAQILAFGATINNQGGGYTRLYSPWQCRVEGGQFLCNAAANFVLDVRGDASGGANPTGGRQAAYNVIGNIVQRGICGTMLRLYGTNANNGFVTLNTFTQMGAEYVSVRGYDFAQWCDSNTFIGKHRANLAVNNAVGVEHNTADPLNNVGVYTNDFFDLAIDTFNPGSFVGRIGIKVNNAKDNKCFNYYNHPVAEGGSVVASAAAGAYDFGYFDDATGSIRNLSNKRENQGTQTNDNAPAGFIGEYLEQNIASGSAIALTTDTAAGVATITLTPGDWDVTGTLLLAGNAATTIGYIIGSINTSVALGAENATVMQRWFNNTIGTFVARLGMVTRRITVAAGATQAVYLVGQAGFGVNTLGAYGVIRARRVR